MAMFYHGTALPVRACTVCIAFPERTATDHVLEADCVVLCRPLASNPFVFAQGELLKGVDSGGEINLLVDTRTRRLLLAETRRYAVLFQNERDGDWRSLGVVSDEYMTILRRIAVFGVDWTGDAGAERRWKFFLPLFGNEDPSIRELAYLEMGRAPYPIVRKLGRIAPRETYASFLRDSKYLEWRSLAILLLAQSEAPDDRRLVRESYEAAKRLRMATNLGALAAALIEVEGLAAITEIEGSYLRSASRSAEEIDAIVGALSMHGSADNITLQDRVVESCRVLLTHHPRCTPRVAAKMTEWGRRELVKEVADCADRQQGFDIEEKLVIQRYLRNATATRELALVGK